MEFDSDYSNRKLHEVTVERLQHGPVGKDEMGYSGSVRCILSSAADETKAGPVAIIRFALPSEHSIGFAELERRFLEAAHGILARLASETPVSLGEGKRRDDESGVLSN